MRILLMHPNYHSGGAEIAGNWPPAWVAYLTGYLRAGGYNDVTFVDAMTHHLDDEAVRARIEEIKPDIVGCAAITPAIYKAERLLQIAKEVNPACVTVLGGIHGTFMYPQVPKEAPWIDAVVCGEGEQVFLNFVRAVDDGSWARDRHSVNGVAFATPAAEVVATPAEPPIQDRDRITPDWGILEWDKYIYIPMGVRVAIPNFARGCPFTCSFCSQWKFRRKYLMGCLKAFLKSGFERTFYDLGRVGYWGPQSKKKVDFSFADQRVHARPDPAAIAAADENWVTMHGPKIEMRRRKGEETFAAAEAAMACGGGHEQLTDEQASRA